MIPGIIFLFLGLLFAGVLLLEIENLIDDWWWSGAIGRIGMSVLIALSAAVAILLLITGTVCFFE